MDREAPDEGEVALFGLGCFWGPDALFGAMEGVVRTCVGYAGGTTPAPTYDDIGDHIEAVRLEFDPSAVTYADLLGVFWSRHDPARAPFKRQYQTAVFPQTDAQAEAARRTAEQVGAALNGAMATEVIEGASFTRAEGYHQKHTLQHHDRIVRAFRRMLPGEEGFVDSPAVALANGYAAGHRPPERLSEDLPRMGLAGGPADALRERAERRHDG
jgi:peptide-methionine (S)-S-oxide reductase